MRKDREDLLDPSQPALIVTYGNTTRKRRPINGELVVIGRSSCCDVGLVSPEVAPIHCVMVKGADGWRIRDCTGRSGTRVNGKAITDEPLHDGDALQIGTFSFQLNLPRTEPTERKAPQAAAAAIPAAAEQGLAVAPSHVAETNKADDVKLLHLKQSRERLGRHALNLRRKLREKSAAPSPAAPVGPSRLDSEINAKRAELEQMEKKFKFWEKELTEQDRSLREEYCEMEHQRKELERFAQETLARKQVDLEHKAQAILADHRKGLETEMAGALAQRRAEIDKLVASLEAREHDLEVERGQMEEKVLQVLVDKRTELLAAEEEFKEKKRAIEEQLTEAEEIKAEVAEGREALRLEYEDVDRMREEAQEELKSQVREAEEHLEKLWEQCEGHRKRVEEQHGPIVVLPDVKALTHDVDVRSRELAQLAKHLEQTRTTLTQYEQELSEAYQQFHEEYDKAVQETQALQNAAAGQRGDTEKNGFAADASREPQSVDRLNIAESIIAEMREETAGLRADFEAKLAEERARTAKAHDQIKSLQAELEDLQQELKHREEILEHLKSELELREEKSRRPSPNGEMAFRGPEQLMALVDQLQEDLVERDGQLRELHKRLEKLQLLSDPDEKEAYEGELNRYRIELEQDRAWLNEEMARLQVSKAEIDETRQEEELRISHERVEIAREWAEINRIRDQLRRDVTKDKAESALRERAKAKATTVCAAVELTPAPTPPPTTATPQPDLISRLARSSRNGHGTTP